MENSNSEHYVQLLKAVKEKVSQARTKAMVTVNQHLLRMYWEVGSIILEKQKQAGWGSKVIEQLSKDLRKAFPDMKGFSRRNLLYMRRFSEEYPDFSIVQPVVAQISWSHNVRLLEKCSDKKERLWYAKKALEHGWSRNVMVAQIETDLYGRSGKAISNFESTLPALQSDMAQGIMKDPYVLDFLNLTEDAKEKEMEDAITEHITSFLLELGVGFAFVGRQYHVEVGDSDFYIDLLFYHLKLRCYVVLELKMKKFKPEFAGKLNFYLSVVDDTLRSETDKPSIGIILCKDRDEVMVEYALRDVSKPIGISTFDLTSAIPKDLQSKLPSIEALEQELRDLGA